MTEMLCLKDSYLREFEARVISANGKHIFLDKTAFYPSGGGQPNDIGKLVRNKEEFGVIAVTKSAEGVCHEVDKEGLAAGDSVKGSIDWERRYKLMRMHTASHLLSAIFNQRAGAMITGNQLDTQRSRIDFSLEEFDKDKILGFCNEANAVIKNNPPVRTYFLPREEAMKIPNVIKLAGAMPPSLETLRIVEIDGVDKQLDGGTHVKALGEIGKIEIAKMENKGKTNRRVYFTLSK
jgi:Ser-tRNA(Ala) deacylase AlaX